MKAKSNRMVVTTLVTIVSLLVTTVSAADEASAGQQKTRLPLELYLNTPGTWPEYTRGKGKYEWVLTPRARDSAISYLGSHERLRVVVDRIKKGQPVKIATIGGSITAGQGCIDAPNWPQWLFNHLEDNYGSNVKGNNGAVGGTVSSYMSACHNIHVPKDADVVFVEYSVNDLSVVLPVFDNQPRRSFERLLRKLLQYPNKPAVVLVHTYIWWSPTSHPGNYYSTAERDFLEFSLYYGLPAISLKACCWELMAANVLGFDVTAPRSPGNEAKLKKVAFYFDRLHPDGNTGARILGELAFHLIQRTAQELETQPVSATDVQVANATLPAPMIPNNWESISDRCFIGMAYTKSVTKKSGFEWINESKTDRPKWGFVSTQPGSKLTMTVDTRSSAALKPGGAAKAEDTAAEMLVELAYLRSYENMGRGKVTCGGGCTCKESIMEGHTTQHTSQLHLHHVYVSQAENCEVSVEVLPDTSSGKNKVKVAGIMVSEEGGQQPGIRNELAVEYVHDISMRAKDHVFEVMNHA